MDNIGSLQKFLQLVTDKVKKLEPEQKQWLKVWFRESFDKRRRELQGRER